MKRLNRIKQLAAMSLMVTVGLICNNVTAQTNKTESKSLSIGTEVDALPYLTGGYYGSTWVSKNHFRYRAVVTKLNTPEFLLEDGFTDNTIHVYAAIVDYFFQPTVKQWWVGAGFEYWDASIRTDNSNLKSDYNQTVFTLGGGYVWKFYHNFYLNPWVAVHARIAGDKDVHVESQVFSPSSFTPEASLKLGWYLSRNRNH